MDGLGRKLIGASWVAAGWKDRALGEGSPSAQILSREEGCLRPPGQETEDCREKRGAGRGRELRSRLLEGPGRSRAYVAFASLFKETQA